MDDSESSDGEILQVWTNTSEREVPDVRLEADYYDTTWMEKYQKLEAFRKAFGHCNVTQLCGDTSLVSWAYYQRTLQREGKLRKDRERALNELGFTWSPAVTTEMDSLAWTIGYCRLVDFKAKYGHTRVSIAENEELHIWIQNQKIRQLAGFLGQDREHLLNELGLVWIPPRNEIKEDKPWMDCYNRLVLFKRHYGHLDVPVADDMPLNNWMTCQRYSNTLGKLSKNQTQLLNNIGFDWVPDKSASTDAGVTLAQKNEEAWDKMFDRLVAYRRQHGHTDIQADSDDQKLARWVAMQRVLRVHGKIATQHEKALCEIGLSWEPPTADESARSGREMSEKDEELWMSQFQSLCEYKEKHGCTTVPCTGDTSKLAHWLFVQQHLMKIGRLSEAKKRLLKSVWGIQIITPVLPTLGSVPSDEHAASITEATVEAESRVISTNFDEGTGFRIEAPGTGKSARHSGNSSVACAIGGGTYSEASTIQAPVPGTRSSTVETAQERDVSSEADLPATIAHATPTMDEKFVVGTRIEKVFDVNGISQKFGGNVGAFEYFEDEEGNQTWGYLIHYDDGDQEHMLEADVAQNRVAVQTMKRAGKNQKKPPAFKRVKQLHAPDTDARSISSVEDNTTDPVSVDVNINLLKQQEPSAPKKSRKSRPYSRSIYSCKQQ